MSTPEEQFKTTLKSYYKEDISTEVNKFWVDAEAKRLKTSEPSIINYLHKFKYLKKKFPNKLGGTKTISFKNEINNEFFLTRRSVRNFNKKPINKDIIMTCIKNSIYGTPTVCNRPINKVKIITKYEKRKELLKYQGGNAGFGLSAPVLIIVTANLENYERINERRSPYIGGGMLAQSIIYSLHAKGIGSCCLNWDTNYSNDVKVKKILGLINETIIMYIVAGYYDDNIKVPFSDKVNIDKNVTFIE